MRRHTSQTVLRSHAAHGDNLSFTILVYVTHQQYIHIRNPSWSSKTILDALEAASKSMCKIRHLSCSTSSMLSRIKLSPWRRVIVIGRPRSVFCSPSATCTTTYTMVPILPRHGFPPPLVMRMTFRMILTHISFQYHWPRSRHLCLYNISASHSARSRCAVPCLLCLSRRAFLRLTFPISHRRKPRNCATA